MDKTISVTSLLLHENVNYVSLSSFFVNEIFNAIIHNVKYIQVSLVSTSIQKKTFLWNIYCFLIFLLERTDYSNIYMFKLPIDLTDLLAD